MDNKLNVKLIELNNKSRQGLYYYIKEPSKKGVYLKYNPEFPLDSYLEYYKDKQIDKNTKSLSAYQRAFKGIEVKPKYKQKHKETFKRAEDYFQKLNKKPKLSNSIKKGLAKVTVKNIQHSSIKDINDAKKELLRNLVADEQLLDLLIQEENLKKLQNRIETKIEFRSVNDVLAYSSKIGMTPNQVYNKMRGNEYIGLEIDPSDGYETIFSNKLQFNGFNKPKLMRQGFVNSINVTFIFRKNR